MPWLSVMAIKELSSQGERVGFERNDFCNFEISQISFRFLTIVFRTFTTLGTLSTARIRHAVWLTFEVRCRIISPLLSPLPLSHSPSSFSLNGPVLLLCAASAELYFLYDIERCTLEQIRREVRRGVSFNNVKFSCTEGEDEG